MGNHRLYPEADPPTAARHILLIIKIRDDVRGMALISRPVRPHTIRRNRVSQGEEQKSKAFEAALNRHGFALQYAVAQSARSLATTGFSNWFPLTAEFPVRVQGADTRIDLVLEHRRRGRFLVVETKRANPALAYWCFAKSGFAGCGLQKVHLHDSGRYPSVLRQ